MSAQTLRTIEDEANKVAEEQLMTTLTFPALQL